jgi:hypothetical protein
VCRCPFDKQKSLASYRTAMLKQENLPDAGLEVENVLLLAF